jgi:hypothetical protein
MKFLTTKSIVDAENIVAIDCDCKSFLRLHTDMLMVSQTAENLFNLDEDPRRNFYINATQFYTTAFQYLTKKLPCLYEELYRHSEVADVELRLSVTFRSVLFFYC